jgi:hypothetical protein
LNIAHQKAILSRGLASGLRTTWTLGKIIFPITFVVVILQHTPVIDWLIAALGPAMGLLGLRGEAAIPLVLGVTLNLYAAIAAILSLSLTVKEVFILAILISFAHNMFVETGVALKVGVRLWVVLLVRFGLGILWALIIKYCWAGGNELAVYSMAPEVAQAAEGWRQVAWLALVKATMGTFQVALIVIPLMLIIQFLKEHNLLQLFSKRVGRFTRFIGLQPNASLTLVAGFLTGLAYGAGVMIQAVEQDGVSRKDATLALIFLMASHAIVEDTLLFVPLGVPIWALLALRVSTAIVVTATAAAVWRRWERARGGDAVIVAE